MEHVANECTPCGAMTIFAEDATYPRRCARCGARLLAVRWALTERRPRSGTFVQAQDVDDATDATVAGRA